MQSWRAVDIFSVLGNATRYQLIRILAQTHPRGQRIADLRVDLDVSRQTVRRHLMKLENAGLVSCRRIGNTLVFRAEAPLLEDFLDCLDNTICPPNNRIGWRRRDPGRIEARRPYRSLTERLKTVRFNGEVETASATRTLPPGDPLRPRDVVTPDHSLADTIDELNKHWAADERPDSEIVRTSTRH